MASIDLIFDQERYLWVLAHPDDEIQQFGLIQRLHQLGKHQRFIIVTNGDSNVPEDVLRSLESREAFKKFGLENFIEFLDYSQKDVDIAFLNNNSNIFKNIKYSIECRIQLDKPHYVMTTAFEGGNPTHDVLNYIVNKIIYREVGRHKVGIEFPQYHMSPDGLVFGRFWNQVSKEHIKVDNIIMGLHLKDNELLKKIECIDFYKSQQEMIESAIKIAGIGTAEYEMFRKIPKDRDYNKKPHDKIFYERYALGNQKYPRIISFSDFKKIIAKIY